MLKGFLLPKPDSCLFLPQFNQTNLCAISGLVTAFLSSCLRWSHLLISSIHSGLFAYSIKHDLIALHVTRTSSHRRAFSHSPDDPSATPRNATYILITMQTNSGGPLNLTSFTARRLNSNLMEESTLWCQCLPCFETPPKFPMSAYIWLPCLDRVMKWDARWYSGA